MNSAFARLLKVLVLERRQGFRNKAVIGGLDKFASRWEADARAEIPDSPAVSEIVSLLIGYPAVEDAAARERIVELILRRVREIAPETAAAEERAARPFLPPPPVPAGAPPSAAAPHDGAPSQPRNLPLAAPRDTALSQPKDSSLGQPKDAAAPRDSILGQPKESTLSLSKGAEPDAPAEAPPAEPSRERPGERFMPAVNKPAPPAPAEPPPAPPAPVARPAAPNGKPETAPPASPEALARPPAPHTTDIPPQPPPAPAPVAPHLRESAVGLRSPVTRLPGVGPHYAERLAHLGVHTVLDLLFLLPTRYDDFSQLRTIDKLRWGEEVTVIGTVWDLKSRIIGDDRRMITALVGDGTGEIEMTWFNPYVERRLRAGQAFMFSGKIDSYRGHFLMRNPEFEPLDRQQIHTGRLVPTYPLTEGITIRWLREVMNKAVEAWAADVPDFLPAEIRRSADLMPLAEALAQIHFPDNMTLVQTAHRRLSFDEFLLLQLGVLGARQRFQTQPGRALRAGDPIVAPFLSALPFTMTGAQRRTLNDITADLTQTRPMSRLLQGDVGSGKTAVAAAALWVAVANGAQGAILAPTEILAEQHARSFGRMFAGLAHPISGQPIRVALFTGHTPRGRAEREAALADLARGEIDIAVGTHALIQGEVAFRDLAVAVVDEQHRFGVEQRGALRSKGIQPHMLVMSATPIPRSLALTIYGDLDVSVIDEMPAGRTPIKTKWLTSNQRERAYDFIRRQAAAGRQAFIVYPLVEESERTDAKAAVAEHARLQESIFPALRLGLLHGRLRSEEKDSVMRAFGAGELDVLVATSVVEVGIDVPNATVIVIEGAERFGLAQLHQFRGRVGRGEHPSYCILLSDAAEGESVQRLQALETNRDGFALAQIDLELRGPGDFFGTRQSGLPPLKTAQLTDLRTLELARTAARQIFAADPFLTAPEHRALAGRVAAFWNTTGDMS
jgi:ATP-dependent DNA helicase RecG